MAKINLLRTSNSYDKNMGSYRMQLEVISTEDITKHIFVKQRVRNFFKSNFDDLFAAVATPAQLEDFNIDAPNENSSYFRDSKIDIVSRNPKYLEEVFDEIISQLQKLVGDTEALNVLQADGIYQIDANHINLDMSILHTHYRLPLTAAPCGLNSVTGEIQSVGSQDMNLQGWVNRVSTDPTGYSFRYNIDKDSTLKALFPIETGKIQYAHIEVNGITTANLLFTGSQLYWKSNAVGYAPWPIDWTSTENPGSSEHAIVLVFDFIK